MALRMQTIFDRWVLNPRVSRVRIRIRIRIRARV